MKILFTTRPLYPDERRLLTVLKTKKEKQSRARIKYHYFLIAALLGVGFTFQATIVKAGFFVFTFGTIAILAYSLFAQKQNGIIWAKLDRPDNWRQKTLILINLLSGITAMPDKKPS